MDVGDGGERVWAKCVTLRFSTQADRSTLGAKPPQTKTHPSHPLLPFGHDQDMAVCPLLMLEEQCKNGCGVRMAVPQYGNHHMHCASWRHPLRRGDCFDPSYDRPPLHGWDLNKLRLDPKMLSHSLSESMIDFAFYVY